MSASARFAPPLPLRFQGALLWLLPAPVVLAVGLALPMPGGSLLFRLALLLVGLALAWRVTLKLHSWRADSPECAPLRPYLEEMLRAAGAETDLFPTLTVTDGADKVILLPARLPVIRLNRRTLADKDENQIATIAHELGHALMIARRGRLGLAHQVARNPLIVCVLWVALTLGGAGLLAGLGVPYAALPVLVACALTGPVLYLITAAGARQDEFLADAIAAELAGRSTMIRLLNSFPLCGPERTRLMDLHPSVKARVEAVYGATHAARARAILYGNG